jgi:hypothetical protein
MRTTIHLHSSFLRTAVHPFSRRFRDRTESHF